MLCASFYANKSPIFCFIGKIRFAKVTQCIVNKSLLIFFLVIELTICEDYPVIFKYLSLEFSLFGERKSGSFLFLHRASFFLLSFHIKYSRLKKFPFFDARARFLKIFTLEWRPRYKIHMTRICVSCNSLRDLYDGNIIFARLFDRSKEQRFLSHKYK